MAQNVTVADVQAASDVVGLSGLLAKLGYDASSPVDQTAAALGVAEKAQGLIRHSKRLVAQNYIPAPQPPLEIYWFEASALTAELRRNLASAFRNKPLLRYLLIITPRDFSQLDFVLVEKGLSQVASGTQVAVTHQLFSVDRRHPSRVHLRVINRLSNTAADGVAQSERLRDAFRLAEWSEDEFNNRNLFSDYFLKNRLPQQQKSPFPAWHGDFKPAFIQLGSAWREAGDVRSLSGEAYLNRFILPMISALGFSYEKGEGDGKADYFLSPAKDAPPCAALLVYPWDRALDRKDDLPRPGSDDVPGIRVVKVLEEQKLPWAILTNGKDWRLYCAQAHSRATNYYEIDLPDALQHDDLIAFRYFYLFFRAEAFTAPPGKQSFLDQLREGSAAFAKELGDRLRKHVFDDVFPYLAQGFVDFRKQKFDEKTTAGDEFLVQTYDATLTLLYRLLFLLYAESLDLLPVNEPAYAELSLGRLKREIAEYAGPDIDGVDERLKKQFTKSDTKLYDRLMRLASVIDQGSKDHNVPTYNGGLFSTAPQSSDKTREADAARFLKKHKVADYYLARALDLLARGEDSKTGELVFVDYKSLGVRQLGSIYEGLLMYHVVIPADDWEKGFARPGLKVALVPSNKERKSTGSYFTPQHIVKYIVTQTVGPLLEEKFIAMAPRMRQAQRDYHDRKRFETDSNVAPILRNADEIVFKKHAHLVHELLDIKVLDPAMGSGHFLVETVDFITDKLLDFIAGFPWNPVQSFIDRRVRRPIIDSLLAQGVKINEERLTDVNLIKRLVMKRCVYGVDLNPMAVELTKVSVWLDSFTLGAPLSFMDHHFKCGNSLIGASIADLKKLAADHGGLWTIPMEPLERATRNMELIADISDVTLTEVHQSAQTYHAVLAAVKGYRVLLDCITAEHFGVKDASTLVTEGSDLDLEHWDKATEKLPAKEKEWVEQATAVSEQRSFFHWDLGFPDVFYTSRRPEALRRFDAVVGNPPWGAGSTETETAFHRAVFNWSAKQNDSYLDFTEHSHTALRPGGRFSMILPDAWLTGTKYSSFRGSLLLHATPTRLVDLPYNVFEEAYVDCCILSTLSAPAQQNKAASVVATKFANADSTPDRLTDWPEFSMPLDQLIEDPEHSFALLDPDTASILRKLKSTEVRVEAIAFVDRGLEAYGGATPRNTRDRRGHHSATKRGSKWIPQFSGDLRRYSFRLESDQFVNTGAALAECPPLEFFAGPRLLLRRLVSRQYRLMAITESRQFAVDSSTLIAKPRTDDAWLNVLLALANSALFSFFQVAKSNIAQRDDYPRISLYEVRSWPIPLKEVTDGAALKTYIIAARKLSKALDNLSILSQCNVPGEMLFLAAELAGRILALENHAIELQDQHWNQALQVAEIGPDAELSGRTVLDDLDQIDYFERTIPSNDLSNGIPVNCIASVYPAMLFGDVDEDMWEIAAWEEFCSFLRKNKSKIGNTRIRADLTGSGAVANPTGAMRKLQETFLKYHREIRQNRAKAAELDFLIDRIVFKLFDLTLEEQKLILSRVGPGRPLPPRRGRKKKAAAKDEGPQLFEA